jgi:DNA-binding SARP family transcriptional activator
VEFRILGPIEVRDDDRVVPLGAGRQRALLALLLLHANKTVSRDRLIDALWGERPPNTAVTALQGHVSGLRKLLEPDRASEDVYRVILTRGSGYEIRLQREQLDLGVFERLRSEGRHALARGEPERAAARLREGLALWRGTPLADVAYEPFAQTEIARLEELRVATLEDRLEADLASGRHSELVGELEALVKEYPLRERLRRQLMLALYRAGRQAEALEAYQAARRALVKELGIEPGRELRELQQAILRHDPSLDVVSAGGEADEAGEELNGDFVGREAELGALLADLEDALAGRGRLCLLVGEPGIGKSRLADELIRRARRRGMRVAVGRCWEAGGAPAYWPWVQSLRAYIREVDSETLRNELGAGAVELGQILPELHQIFPELPSPLARESEAARFRLFEATAELLRNASARRPLLLVLDDLHAADAPSLLLLRFLARELGSARMLVVGAYRDVDPIPAQPLIDMVSEIAREPVTRRLALRGLSEGDVATYVDLTASDLASHDLVTALHAETEGNPLFVSETVRLLAAEGLPSEPAEGPIVIPETVRDVIARRVTHLSDECKRVLVRASVLGREFDLAALARVSDTSEDELLDALDEAIVARVVSDVPGGSTRLRFAHVLIRDTLYEGLSSPRRIRAHRLTVEALEALYGDEPGPHFAELAHHSIAGRDFDRGVRYARRAGDRALDLLAYEEAVRLYETALEALDVAGDSDERTRCELLLLRGTAAGRAGNTPAADEALSEAAGIARRLGLSRELARAAAEYGGRMVWARGSDAPGLVPLLEEGLAGIGADDVELRARLLARLAGALRDERSRDRRDALSREAVDLARRAESPAALVEALDGRAMAVLAPDTLAECIAVASELREVAERIGDRERVVDGYMQRVAAQVVVGDIAAVEADLDAASPLAEELGQPAHLWDVCGARAMVALAAGRLSEGEQLVEQAFVLGERAVPGAFPVHRLQRYTLADFLGSLEDVEAEIRDLVTEYPGRPVFRCVLAHLHARLGRFPEAMRALADLREDDFSELPFDQEWLFAMSLLAETSALVGDDDSASALYGLLFPWSALNVADMAEGIRGSVARYLGLLAAALSRLDAAASHFEDAIAMNARMGARPWFAYTHEDYARMLLARNASGDRERSRQLVDEALAIYRELGMDAHVPSAVRLRERGTRVVKARSAR